MEKNKLTKNDLKKLFPRKNEVEFKRRVVESKELPVGCRKYGMVLKSEEEPCDDPRCTTCKNRVAQKIVQSQEDIAWQERRDRRKVEGFSLGTFETEEELHEYKEEELKRGNYAYVGTTMHRFCGREWKEVNKD